MTFNQESENKEEEPLEPHQLHPPTGISETLPPPSVLGLASTTS